jgi:HAD superfamily hydrolase (TIGR01509 family)
MLDAVIFDMDGVLADSEPIHLATANRVLAPFQVRITAEENQDYLGLDEPTFWFKVVERHNLEADPGLLGAQRVESVVEEIRNGILPLPGVPELVTGLVMRGLDLAVASSSPRAVVDAVLKELGLRRTFKTAISGDQVAKGKPEPDIFLLAAQELGVPPDRCMVIEDSPMGLSAARRAGMFTVAVQNRYNLDLDLSEADRIFSGLDHFDWSLLDER